MNRINNNLIIAAVFFLIYPILNAAENQWSWGGPEEARVRTIAISPQNNQHIWIGTIEHGIYRSTNGGLNWQHLDNSLIDNACMREIVFHPDAPETVFIATYYGMFKSVDGGNVWYLLNTPGSSTREIRDIEIHPINHNIIFACGDLAYYKSTDSGESWAEMDLSWLSVTSVKVAPQHPNTIYISTESAAYRRSVYRSDDLGVTWGTIHNDLDTSLYLFDLEIDPLNDSVIYVCGINYFNHGTHCVAKTTDGGSHWFDISPDSMIYYYGNSITISPLDHNTLYLCTEYDGVLVSTNAGQDWNPLNNGHRAPSTATICIDSSSGHLYLGTYYHGIFRSTNGGQLWQKISSNLKHTSCVHLAVNPACADSLLVTSYTGILYRSTDGGNLWNEVTLPVSPPHFKAWKPVYDIIDRNYIYLSYFHVSPPGEAGILRSTDGGITWEKFTNGLQQNTGYYQPAISYFPGGHRRIFITSYSGLFYSDSLGTAWEQATNGLPGGMGFNAIGVSSVNPYLVYAVEYNDGTIYRSEDAGESWQEAATPPGSNTLYEFACDPVDENIIYAGREFTGIFKSTDKGESWNNINGNIPPFRQDQFGLSGLAVNPLNPLNIYVYVMMLGCFVTYNGGENWSAFNTGLSTYNDYAVTAIAPSDTSRIYLGTYVNSVWAFTRIGNGVDDDNGLPNAFSLSPNYPNPFNSSTTIRYTIPIDGPVTLDIYDILGRKVQTLIDIQQQAGEHQAVWEADKAASGMYFYRMQAGDKVVSKPMILLK